MQIKIIIYRTPPGTATITTISRYLQETLRDYESIEENGLPGKWLTDWLTDQSCRISLSLIINDGSSSRRTRAAPQKVVIHIKLKLKLINYLELYG